MIPAVLDPRLRPPPSIELPTVDVSRLDIRKMVVQVLAEGTEVAVRVVLAVRDVDLLMPMETQSHYTYSQFEILAHHDPRALALLIRRQCLAALEHELDECLFVNGERVTEPHPEGRR